MKRKIFTLLLCAGFVAFAYAQQPSGVVHQVDEAPVIDGVVDACWADAEAYNIDLPFQLEVPTVGESGETTWQAVWSADGISILLTVTDDAFYPNYAVSPAGNDWEYDKPELYFDVNYVLVDGIGGGGGQGHYQVAPGFLDGSNDGTLRTTGDVSFAFMVTEPNYIAEYFIPFSHLVDKDNIMVDLTGNIGFDVTIIDRDPGDAARKRAVWANVGAINESWSNMDECGIITFEGAEPGIDVESITLTAGNITENNQPLQIAAAILPENATVKTLTWSVENGTGRAKISQTGVLTPIVDGTVTVTAKAQDAGYEEAEIEVTISGQIVSLPELSLIRNGFFDEVTATGGAAQWNGTSVVEDGVVLLDPNPGGVNYWDFTLTQATFGCNITDTYTFTFVLWGDESDTVDVDFEDSNNGYNRYGTTTHAFSSDGQSDWVFVSNTEPTKYTFDVVFNEKLDNTHESAQFMLGLHDAVVHIDSVMLYNNNDLALLSAPVAVPVTGVTLSSAGDATTVAMGETLQMSATVAPETATYQGAWFSVVNGTGVATINPSTGLLTAVSAGKVTVVATAKDEDKVSASKEITITWPTGIQKQSMNQIKVYPNPAESEITVILTSVNQRVTIYNSVGQKMKEEFVTGTQQTFDISRYAKGLYFVKAGDMVVKFIK